MSGMLRANSLIAVVAPAGIPDRQGLEQGISLLRTWGFDVVEGHHIADVEKIRKLDRKQTVSLLQHSKLRELPFAHFSIGARSPVREG